MMDISQVEIGRYLKLILNAIAKIRKNNE